VTGCFRTGKEKEEQQKRKEDKSATGAYAPENYQLTALYRGYMLLGEGKLNGISLSGGLATSGNKKKRITERAIKKDLSIQSFVDLIALPGPLCNGQRKLRENSRGRAGGISLN